MKAMMLKDYSEPLSLVDVAVPEIGLRDVLVKVRSCGVCGTDVKICSGLIGSPLITLPHIPGHEPAGEVAEVGRDVSEFKPGDRVSVYLYVTCGECIYCRSGRENLCLNLERIGFDRQGAFAEYLAVPARQLTKIGNDLAFEHAAVLTDAVVVPYHAIRRQARAQVGDSLMIVGVGGLGIHAVQIAKLAGTRVIAVDINQAKLDLATEYGADHTINPRNVDVLEVIHELTRGIGVDAVIENVSSAETMGWSLPATKKGGRVVIVGYSPGNPFPCDSMAMHYNEWEILGSRLSTKQDLNDVIDLVERGRLQPVVTKTFPLSSVNDALDLLSRDAVLGRAVLTL